MTGELRSIITAADREKRNASVDAWARHLDAGQLLAECADLDAFRRTSSNLYERVRALFFLYDIHRFHLPQKPGVAQRGFVPFDGYSYLLTRRFEEVDRHFPARAGGAGAEPVGFQRAGRRVSPAGLPDPGRPGAAQRPLGARQPVDVPPGPSRGPAAADPERAARASFARCAVPDPPRDHAGAHGPVAQRLERHLLSRHGLSRGRPGSEHLRRPGRARAGCSAPPARRGVSPRHRRASAPPGQRRPWRPRGHHQPRRGVRLRARLPGLAQSRVDRVGSRAAGHGGLRGAPVGPSDAARRARPRARAGQQRERHPQGLAAGGFDQPAGLPDRLLHAGDRPGPRPDRAAWRAGAAAGGGPGDPGRVAGGLGRRLAGLGRGLAGHQADLRCAGRGRRPGVRHQPRPPAARASYFRCGRGLAADAARPAG